MRSCEITKYWDPCINYMYLVVNSSKPPFYEDHLLLNRQAFLEDEADHCCALQMLLLYEPLIIYLSQQDGGSDVIYGKKIEMKCYKWQDMNGLVKAANDFPVGL